MHVCIRDMENMFEIFGISTQDYASNSEGLYGVPFFYNIYACVYVGDTSTN